MACNSKFSEVLKYEMMLFDKYPCACNVSPEGELFYFLIFFFTFVFFENHIA